ncbi:transposase [Leisingera sp. MMG025]|nr:transposase [Leisingera sp. MMG026]MCF6432023.1 transposase [Leisingera sp. MMG026]
MIWVTPRAVSRWLQARAAVADTLEPGATVNGVAARYGGLANQLTAWRRLAKQGRLVLPAAELDEPVFAPQGSAMRRRCHRNQTLPHQKK